MKLATLVAVLCLISIRATAVECKPKIEMMAQGLALSNEPNHPQDTDIQNKIKLLKNLAKSSVPFKFVQGFDNKSAKTCVYEAGYKKDELELRLTSNSEFVKIVVTRQYELSASTTNNSVAVIKNALVIAGSTGPAPTQTQASVIIPNAPAINHFHTYSNCGSVDCDEDERKTIIGSFASIEFK